MQIEPFPNTVLTTIYAINYKSNIFIGENQAVFTKKYIKSRHFSQNRHKIPYLLKDASAAANIYPSVACGTR